MQGETRQSFDCGRRSKMARMVLTRADGSESNTTTPSKYAATCFKPLVTLLMTLTNQPGDALLR